MNKYRGLTYHDFLGSKPILWLWFRLFCPKDIHLLDEVLSGSGEHYLICDACNLTVDVSEIYDYNEV